MKKLVIVQYAGDFFRSALNFAQGGEENYRAQKYTVTFVEDLARELDVTVIVGMTEEVFDRVLPSGVRVIGLASVEPAKIAAALDKLAPDLLILRTPMLRLLRWARIRQVRTLALLADSFYRRGIRSWIGRRLLAREMNAPTVDVIANHGRNASRQLVQMGVRPEKVIAWDYPPEATPHAQAPKASATSRRKILFVGAVSKAKGVDDLVAAVDLIPDARLDIIGSSTRTGSEKVRYLGPKPNSEIIAHMREADIVVVPSRHGYSEGIPLTIYEAFCSRTPLVLSDHPMFVGNAVHDESALFFKAGDVKDLAQQIGRLLEDPALYHRLSIGSLKAWEGLQVPVLWHKVIERWIASDLGWICERSLAATAPGAKDLN